MPPTDEGTQRLKGSPELFVRLEALAEDISVAVATFAMLLPAGSQDRVQDRLASGCRDEVDLDATLCHSTDDSAR